jgi:hypothetical protein
MVTSKHTTGPARASGPIVSPELPHRFHAHVLEIAPWKPRFCPVVRSRSGHARIERMHESSIGLLNSFRFLHEKQSKHGVPYRQAHFFPLKIIGREKIDLGGFLRLIDKLL